MYDSVQYGRVGIQCKIVHIMEEWEIMYDSAQSGREEI